MFVLAVNMYSPQFMYTSIINYNISIKCCYQYVYYFILVHFNAYYFILVQFNVSYFILVQLMYTTLFQFSLMFTTLS